MNRDKPITDVSRFIHPVNDVLAVKKDKGKFLLIKFNPTQLCQH